jgi:hypothetical protein
VECSNLYIGPPAAFFPHECDANPTLKSVTLAQYAMDDILQQLARANGKGSVISNFAVDALN